MTDLQVIEQAILSIEKSRTEVQSKRATKATGRKIEVLEIKEGNLEQFKKVIEDGAALVGLYVSSDIGAEVGKIFEVVEGTTKVEIEYLDGGTAKMELADLMYDSKSTAEAPDQDSMITVTAPGEYYDMSFKLQRLFYPGQVELEGVRGVLSAAEWTMLQNDEDDEEIEVEIDEEVDDESNSPEVLYTGGGLNPDIAPDVEFTETITDQTEGNYRFLIGKINETQMVGQLFEDKSDIQELVIQTEPSSRFHWVRSVLVRKYHVLVRPLQAGDKVSIKPWLLGFAPENQEAYHPNDEEENVGDILEDLSAGKPILQRIGVSDEGEIFSGYRRTLAAMLANLEEVPIEVSHFDNRADFVEALFNANKQREKTPEIQAREREIRHKYCSEEARKAQLAQLKNIKLDLNAPKPKARGSAWERTVADEDISASTAAAQSKIINWVDNAQDKELGRMIMTIFNSGQKKTSICKELIKYAEEEGVEKAKKAAEVIITGDAKSLPKALTKAGLTQAPTRNPISQTPQNVHRTPSGVTPVTPDFASPSTDVVLIQPLLPEWVMRLVSEVLGEIDIDILAGTDAVTDAALHLTGVSDELNGLKVDWQLSGKQGACTVFGNLYVDNVHEWTRAVVSQWMKGNISQALIFVSRPDNVTRSAFKGIAAASAEILSTIELQAKGKYYSKANFTCYYLGNNWQAFYNTFEPYADVRMPRWAFDPNYKPVMHTNDHLHWVGNTNGASADYKGMRLSVIKAVDSTWYAEIDGGKVADGLTDEAMAKTIAANTADERLAQQAA